MERSPWLLLDDGTALEAAQAGDFSQDSCSVVKKYCFTADPRRSALDLLSIYLQTTAIVTRPPV